MTLRTVLLLTALVLTACSPESAEPTPTPTATPGVVLPTLPVGEPQGPVDPERVLLDPCSLLTAAEVSEVVGQTVDEGGLSGGEVFQLCTYQLSDGLHSVDVAVVDLQRLEESSGERVSGDEYVATLREGAGDGIVAELDDLGDGEAITIAYSGGSQAWAWTGDRVVGAYADAVPDTIATATALLEAALAQVEAQA